MEEIWSRGSLKGFGGGFGKVWRQEEVPALTEEAGLSGCVVRSDTRGPL